MATAVAREEPRAARWVGAVVILLVTGAALVLLAHELRDYRYTQITAALRSLDKRQILDALAITALAYAILPLYDALAIVYAGYRLPFRRTAFASLIAYGLSQTLGFPMLTSSAVRYRFWSSWGLSTEAIARAVSFVGATFALGIVSLSGLALLLEPGDTLAVVPLPAGLGRIAGLALLLAVLVYIAASISRRGAIRVRGWEFPVPAPRLAVSQLLVAITDWVAAGAVLYALIPSTA